MEFYFESWEVGMFEKSQGKLMSVAIKVFLIQQTVFFFSFLFFFKDIQETVLFMSCDESHTMTVLIFLFLIIFFYIGLKLISLIPAVFQRGFYMHFVIKNRFPIIDRERKFHSSLNIYGVVIYF